MESNFERISEDPLGFTKQTATMLVGLGASDLIPQFKRRNISTQELAELGKQDLIILGADENLADDILKQLRAAARKYSGRDLSEELRTNQLIKILVGANQQLNLIETFIAYARLRLSKGREDFIIDSNKNIRASQALCSATACIIANIDELEKNFRELALELSDSSPKSQINGSRIITMLTGIIATSSIVYGLRYILISIKNQ